MAMLPRLACWRNTSRTVSPAASMCRRLRHNSIRAGKGTRLLKSMKTPAQLGPSVVRSSAFRRFSPPEGGATNPTEHARHFHSSFIVTAGIDNDMGEPTAAYDPRYLGGILHFNARDSLEAHEVWEHLWLHGAGDERRFIHGLMQAAVALRHFGNGNLRGAVKLFPSAKNYMEPYGSPYLGLDSKAFCEQMTRCFSEVFAVKDGDPVPPLDEALAPVIVLDPPPGQWPEPAEF